LLAIVDAGLVLVKFKKSVGAVAEENGVLTVNGNGLRIKFNSLKKVSLREFFVAFIF